MATNRLLEKIQNGQTALGVATTEPDMVEVCAHLGLDWFMLDMMFTGADFPAPTGTPIHATQSGRVVLAEELYFSGNTVIIDHGLGIYSLYGHLSAIDVAAGDEINAGAVLGKVGATGRVTGPHLHWTLNWFQVKLDPSRSTHKPKPDPL